MKKSLFDNWQELQTIADTVEQYDEVSALSLICLLIDTVARSSANTAPELADMIATQVKAVNAEFGAY